ncbi:MAG: hypothetical protein E7538_00575 [Ruminococcaceae bacterium]|nr:hypothetical protein [Oscillospiraceae bacterium]
MKKPLKKTLSIILSVMMLLSLSAVAFAADADYTIVSPYADVIWEGENAWGAYKGSLHSHTTYSDADIDLATMVKEYYNQDYDFLANADHGITGKAWNKAQTFLPLYAYQKLLGNKVAHLTDDEFVGITTGTYAKADGTARRGGMTCVVGANELNNLTLTKSHVNGYFLPEGVGDGFGGRENGYELAIAFVEKAGGLSHINHPGDFLESSSNIDEVSDKENVAFFGDLLLRYDSCLGIEVFNENNSVTPYDRILWDNLLMYCLPYGKNVIGFSNTDAHRTEDIDTSFSVFMMEENTVENIKETMQTGAFFAVTRRLKANDIIGPEKEIDARNTDIPYPVFTKVAVDGHTVSIKAENADTIQWIADGRVIASSDITNGEFTLDLDSIEGAEDFTYIRAELFGKGGICLTQALTIDDGSAPLNYSAPTGFAAIIKNFIYLIKSSLIWTIAVELTRL